MSDRLFLIVVVVVALVLVVLYFTNNGNGNSGSADVMGYDAFTPPQAYSKDAPNLPAAYMHDLMDIPRNPVLAYQYETSRGRDPAVYGDPIIPRMYSGPINDGFIGQYNLY
jgi:hypothetical protein